MASPFSLQQSVNKSPIKTSNIPKLEITKIYPMWPQRVFVQWTLRNTDDTPNYVYTVYRAGSAEGPWEQVSDILPNTYYYVDEAFAGGSPNESPGLFSMERTIYYRVDVQDAEGGEIYSVKRKMESWLDRRRVGIHKKLVRDALISLRTIGTEMAVLKRRLWGTPCPNCRTVSGASTQGSCPTCYGTTYVGGYWDPVYGYAQRYTSPVNVRTAIQGNTERHEVRVLMANIPQVERRDLLVFLRENRRFLVENVTPTQVQNVDVHQELIVSELTPGSTEFSVRVDPWRAPCWWV